MTLSDLYLQVREKEGRLYPDQVVAELPEVSASHPLRAEWRARAASADRLRRYLAALSGPLWVLELGCGNGWLSHYLSSLPNAAIWGLDLRSRELDQAARLFAGEKLAFLAADIFHSPFVRRAFDVIIVASVIQYFPDLPMLIRCLLPLLSSRGELHILDSPIYEESDLPSAGARTRAYYSALGLPDMAAHYFHHTFVELREFAPCWLYRPDSIRARVWALLGRPTSPFPWLCIHGSTSRHPLA